MNIKPRLESPKRCRERVGAGWTGHSGISSYARRLACCGLDVSVQDILDAINHTNLIDSPGL